MEIAIQGILSFKYFKSLHFTAKVRNDTEPYIFFESQSPPIYSICSQNPMTSRPINPFMARNLSHHNSYFHISFTLLEANVVCGNLLFRNVPFRHVMFAICAVKSSGRETLKYDANKYFLSQFPSRSLIGRS